MIIEHIYKAIIDVNVIGIIIGIVVIVSGAIYVIWANRHSKKLAKETGAFRKAEPTIKLYNIVLKNGEHYSVVYGGNFLETEYIWFEFPIELGNIGDKSIENAYLFFNFAPHSPVLFDNSIVKIVSPFPEEVTSRKFSSDHLGQHITIFIKQLNPRVAIQIRELFNFPETERTLKVPATTKDNIDIIVTVAVSFKFMFELVFTAQDHSPQKFYFDIEALNSKNIDELIKFKTKSLNEEIKKQLKNNSEFKIPIGKLILAYPELKLFEVNEKKKRFKYYIGYVNKGNVLVLGDINTK